MKDMSVYHEKQIKELCALHALNNLFQVKNAFTKSQLDEMCKELSPDDWINPHRSVLGLGNYDVNVIMKALQNKGYEAVWFDKRKDPSEINAHNIFGLILNVPTDYKIGFVSLPLRRRHWIAVRQIANIFYNLDSKLDAPEEIGDDNNLIDYLRDLVQSNDKEIFIVVDNETGENRKWLNNSQT